MKPNEKFNIIIDSIEQSILENNLIDNNEILEKAFNDANFPRIDREKNAIFEFLLEKKGREYISERKLMLGYRILLNEDDKKNAKEKAMRIFGEHDDSYYISQFGKLFNMSPKKAIEKNDVSLYQSKPSWESISTEQKGEGMDMFDLLLDLPTDYVKNVRQAMNLKDFYNLNDDESRYAYSLNKNGIDIDEAFKYIADYIGDNKSDDRDKRLKSDLSSDDVRYLYFNCDFGFNDIFKILYLKYKGQITAPIQNCDTKFLKGALEIVKRRFFATGFNNRQEASLQEILDYYFSCSDDKYTDLDFKIYLLYLLYNEYKTAFSMIKPGKADHNEYERLCYIYGNEDLEEGIRFYQEPSDDSYNLVEDYARYETDGYFYDPYDDTDTSDPNDEDAWKEDEDNWIEKEIDNDKPLDFEDIFFDDFDIEEFDKLCDEYDEQLKSDTADISTRKNKKLTINKDLDIETYCKENPNFTEIMVICS